MRMPKVLLVFPPPADPAQPYPSLPALAAFLRGHGCQVTMADLSIEAVHHLLRAGHLRACGARVAEWLAAADSQPSLGPADALRYLRSAGAAGFAWASPDVTANLAALRQPATYASPDRFVAAIGPIDRAFQLVSAAHYPSVVARHSFAPGVDIWRPESLRQLLEGSGEPLLAGWLRARVADLVEDAAPDVVGISLIYPDQLVPALLLATAVRAARPASHICLGGPTVSRIDARLRRLGRLAELFDSAVIGDGEDALLAVSRRIVEGRDLRGIANVWLRGDAGSFSLGQTAARRALDSLPTPDYADLDLDLYLAPEPVLLLNTSRGCYWGRCLFCDVAANASQGYRESPIEQVVNDIRLLQAQTGARHFMFGDLSIRPARLDVLAQALTSAHLDVSWLCQARLEPEFSGPLLQRLAQAGCRGLVFGLESASQRMLDRMGKGTRIAAIERILDDCGAAGISVNLQAFVGFPGETEAEARATESFLARPRRAVTSVSLTSFKLIEGTPALKDPGALGLHSLRSDPRGLDVVWGYQVTEGLSAAEAGELAQAMGARLRAAYPILEKGLSWNAYALLLTSRRGPDGLRLSPSPPPDAHARLRLRPGLSIAQLGYHPAALAELVARATCGEAAASRVRRQPTWTVLDRDSARLVPLDASTHSLLAACQADQDHDGAPGDGLNLRQAGKLIRLLDLGLLTPETAVSPAAAEATS